MLVRYSLLPVTVHKKYLYFCSSSSDNKLPFSARWFLVCIFLCAYSSADTMCCGGGVQASWRMCVRSVRSMETSRPLRYHVLWMASQCLELARWKQRNCSTCTCTYTSSISSRKRPFKWCHQSSYLRDKIICQFVHIIIPVRPKNWKVSFYFKVMAVENLSTTPPPLSSFL